jgi:hypothetical protein
MEGDKILIKWLIATLIFIFFIRFIASKILDYIEKGVKKRKSGQLGWGKNKIIRKIWLFFADCVAINPQSIQDDLLWRFCIILSSWFCFMVFMSFKNVWEFIFDLPFNPVGYFIDPLKPELIITLFSFFFVFLIMFDKEIQDFKIIINRGKEIKLYKQVNKFWGWLVVCFVSLQFVWKAFRSNPRSSVCLLIFFTASSSLSYVLIQIFYYFH